MVGGICASIFIAAFVVACLRLRHLENWREKHQKEAGEHRNTVEQWRIKCRILTDGLKRFPEGREYLQHVARQGGLMALVDNAHDGPVKSPHYGNAVADAMDEEYVPAFMA